MIGRIAGRGIGYITQIILARVLAPEGFGLYAIGWTLLRLFSIAGHLGLDYGVVRFGAPYWHNNHDKLRSVALLSMGGAFLSGLMFGILLYLTAPWLANDFFRKPDLVNIFRGFAVTFPFASTLRVAASTISLSGKMVYGAISEDIAQPIIQTVLFLVFFSMGMGINAALLSIAISYGISLLLALYYVTKSIPNLVSVDKLLLNDLIALLKFSLPAIIGVTLGAFNLWGDRLLVGYFSTETNTGIYQSVSILTMFTTIILSGFKIAIAPSISHLHHERDHNAIRQLAHSTIRWTLYISLPILIFVAVNAKLLITNIFGQSYQAGTVPLLILTLGQVFYVLFGISDQIFLMTGNQKEWFRISAVIFTMTVIFDAILIPREQLIGASIVSSTMMILWGVITSLMLRRKLNFWMFDGSHGKIILAALVTILITYPISLLLNFSFVAKVIVLLPSVFIIFLAALWLTGIEKNDKLLIMQMIRANHLK